MNAHLIYVRVKLKVKIPEQMEQTSKNLHIPENSQTISNFDRLIQIICLSTIT